MSNSEACFSPQISFGVRVGGALRGKSRLSSLAVKYCVLCWKNRIEHLFKSFFFSLLLSSMFYNDLHAFSCKGWKKNPAGLDQCPFSLASCFLATVCQMSDNKQDAKGNLPLFVSGIQRYPASGQETLFCSCSTYLLIWEDDCFRSDHLVRKCVWGLGNHLAIVSFFSGRKRRSCVQGSWTFHSQDKRNKQGEHQVMRHLTGEFWGTDNILAWRNALI